MRAFGWRWTFVVLMCICPALAGAQNTGGVAGRVTNGDTKAAIPQASVRVVGQQASATTDENGQYRITGLAAGRYTITVQRIGVTLRTIDNVVVRTGEVTTLDVETTTAAQSLEKMVVSVTGVEGNAASSVAQVEVVTRAEVKARPSLTIADHLNGIPGVDVSRGGIGQSNIVTRGFNNAFSGSLLTLQDYRFATVPSLRVNVPFLFTNINEDIEQIEVVLGPAAALYGPNSSHGVLHIITKSPFDPTAQGGTVTLDGGSRSIARGSLRYAGIVNPKAAFKISGEAMRGDEWNYRDPGEPTNLTHDGKTVTRDFDVNRLAGEARLDIKPREDVTFTTTYGLSHIGNAIELTGANGAAQVKGWTYQSLQERMSWGNLFAQAFINMSDAGNKDSLDQAGTFLLRSGQPIVDQSRVAAGSVRHSFQIAGGRQQFVYGADYAWTNPRTGGTINGRNEDDDNITEYGGYLHSITQLSDQWQFTAAIRADKNSRLDDQLLSPRAALVFEPKANQNFRIAFNRAYSTPSDFSQFLDLIQLRNAGGLPYDVRAMGVPPDGGWTYRRACAQALQGGLCMRSPFPSALGGANTWVDANAAAYFPAVWQGIVRPRAGGALPPAVDTILSGLNPTSAQITSIMRHLGLADTVLEASLTPIAPLKASFTNNFEVGYKGLVSKSTNFTFSGWYQQRMNFVTTAQNSTPSLFMDPTTTGTYIATQVATGLIQRGMPAAQAQATAAAVAQQLTPGFAQVPVGTVTFDNERLANRTDVLYTYRNVDQTISLWGVDLGFGHSFTKALTLSGTYSFVSKDSFPEVLDGHRALRINAPRHKGSLTGRVTNEARGLTVELRARYTDAYAINSGVYATGEKYPLPGQTCNAATNTGCYEYPGIPTATLLDLGFWLDVPKIGKGALWSVTANNLLDHRVPTFAGVPSLGLMLMTRLQYSF